MRRLKDYCHFLVLHACWRIHVDLAANGFQDCPHLPLEGSSNITNPSSRENRNLRSLAPFPPEQKQRHPQKTPDTVFSEVQLFPRRKSGGISESCRPEPFRSLAPGVT
ncbi:hypothetical protein NPIL_228471 [Nephila pilipes]|uniref:Uncharacterized protein n=1 Tax=Nephila pilipes TaxID=299642 RepID=A0A8X6U2G8_NEPPI|nr:hypothetical protein NPIL_228471 [Nephila pilipes]